MKPNNNRATSATGHSLEEHLLQAQQHDPARVKEFVALKRVLREGYNWCVHRCCSCFCWFAVAASPLLTIHRHRHR
jgi:hypothetical protein